MTFREKLQQERPECVNENFIGGCRGCPREYGYSEDEVENCGIKKDLNVECRKCWNREIQKREETPLPEEWKNQTMKRFMKAE